MGGGSKEDCLEMTEQRAWSSPIYIDYGGLEKSLSPHLTAQ